MGVGGWDVDHILRTQQRGWVGMAEALNFKESLYKDLERWICSFFIVWTRMLSP